MTNGPIHEVIDRWHLHMKGQLPGGLDELLHDDVVFLSPVVFTPQKGKAITMLYLNAASQALPVAAPNVAEAITDSDDSSGKFGYTKEIVDGHHAMLEFETTVDGKAVNGVDIITCDDNGKIVEFKVMVRPLQAVNAVHQQMGQMLEQMKSLND
ncbi:MAG: nuclear transport factor 2 family protein [Ilumatobacteraceae bacterium]|nr:nuclear transport factor 2 family protein [Ilumatobacteraceae bacterium]